MQTRQKKQHNLFVRLCFKFGFAGQIANKANKTCKKITYFDLDVNITQPQTPKHTMYFNLVTQGANFGANTATRIKINFNHQQSTKTDRQNIAPIYTTAKHKICEINCDIVKAKRTKTT